jgi:hypothetical protein
MVITSPPMIMIPGISNMIPRTSAPSGELRNDRNCDFIRALNRVSLSSARYGSRYQTDDRAHDEREDY